MSDKSYDTSSNRPFWEISGPQMLSTTFNAINNMTIWWSLYRPNAEKSYQDWMISLHTAFISLSGHLVNETDERWVKLHDSLLAHFLEEKKMSWKELYLATKSLEAYLYYLGLTRIDTTTIEPAVAYKQR